MATETDIPALASLEYIPYIDSEGLLPEYQGKVGVYAIFDRDKVLQYIGYSRDVDLSIKQHLVRQPHKCYWLKVHIIDRPNRTILENIRDAWIAENGTTTPGNASEAAQWTQPLDAKLIMSADEQASYQASDEITQIKLLKTVARKLETQVMAQLESRGVKIQLRFNPKLKEKGLLDLQSTGDRK